MQDFTDPIECALNPEGAASTIARLAAELTQSRAETAAAYERAAQMVDTCNAEGPYQAIGAATRIRALATESATTALAEIIKKAVEEDREEASEIIHVVAEAWTGKWQARAKAWLARIDQRKEDRT